MRPPTADTSVEDALRRCELFGPLSDRQIGELAACAAARPLKAGEVLFAQDEDALDLFVVAEGRVAVRFTVPDGDEVDVFDAAQYQVCGWSSLIAPHQYVAGAAAVQDGTVLVIPAAAAEDVFLLEPFAGYEVVKLLAADISLRLRNVRSELLGLLER